MNVPSSDSSFARFFVPVATLLLSAAFLGCSRGETDESDSDDEFDPAAIAIEEAESLKRNVGPVYELDDRLVARTGNALRDLRVAWQKQNLERPATGTMTVGPGIGFAVTGADAILRPHGFESVEEFEVALRHVQLALSVVVARESFGQQHRDFDGGALRKKLIDERADLEKSRTAIERDQTLSIDDRRLRARELTEEIDGIAARLADLDSIAGNFGSERAHVPDANIECVRKVKDALLPLFEPMAPSGGS